MRSVVGRLRSSDFGRGGAANETPIFKILTSNQLGTPLLLENSDFHFLRTGVRFAPAANRRLHLGGEILLRKSRAFAASDSFSKNKNRFLVKTRKKNLLKFLEIYNGKKLPRRGVVDGVWGPKLWRLATSQVAELDWPLYGKVADQGDSNNYSEDCWHKVSDS